MARPSGPASIGRMADDAALEALQEEIVGCRRCPVCGLAGTGGRGEAGRLRPRVLLGPARAGVRRSLSQDGGGGAGSGSHGGNRTGRIFTGDRSGDFLFAALYRCGLANQPRSVRRDDGLRLHRVYVTAVNRCCPPGNRPTPEERDACLPFLACELTLLTSARVLLCLGSFAWDGALRQRPS